METESLIRQAQQLIDTCPDINVQANTYDIQQLKNGKKWCRQVAMWTKTICEHSRYNSKVHEFMNWHIMIFQAGNRIRKAYDGLISLLLCGYKLIEQKTSSDKQFVGRIIDEQNDTGPMPVAEFVTHAKKRIKSELKNPFNGWQLANFNSGGLATSNPVIERILERLDQAQRWLAMNILRLGINCKERMSFQQNSFSSGTNTKWTQAYGCLEKEFVSPEAIQASPWAWLGVNMLGYCIPPSHDIFESLPQNTQRSIAIKVTSANICPTPNHIKVIREALRIVTDDLAAGTSVASDTDKNRVQWNEGDPNYYSKTQAIKEAKKVGQEHDIDKLKHLNYDKLKSFLRQSGCTIKYMSCISPPRGRVHKQNWQKYLKAEKNQATRMENAVEKEVLKRLQ